MANAIGNLIRRRVLDVDALAAIHAGTVHRFLSEQGKPIGLADTWQAGVCLRYRLPLATRNRRHFERVPDLELYEWDQ
jgi:predicted nucleic acid-binding protein